MCLTPWSGPVVRINPNEIHLSDPEQCHKIYFVGSRYGKDPLFYGAFGTEKSTFTTPSPDLHRIKRAALNPLFSRKRVLDLESMVQQRAEKLVSRMRRAFETTGQIDLHHGFRAISIDVITDYAFDQCYNFLDDKYFGVDFFDMMRDIGPAYWFFQQFPTLQVIAVRTPFWLAKSVSRSLTRRMVHQQVGDTTSAHSSPGSNSPSNLVARFNGSKTQLIEERKYRARLSSISFSLRTPQRAMWCRRWTTLQMRLISS